MLKRQKQLRIVFHQLMDAGLLALGFWCAHCFRDLFPNSLFSGLAVIEPFHEYMWLLMIIVPFCPILLEMQGFYQGNWPRADRVTMWRLFNGCVLSVVGVILVMFLLRIQLARSVIILFGVTSYAFLLGRVWIMHRCGQTELARSQRVLKLVLVGTRAECEKARREVFENRGEDVEVVAEIDLSEMGLDQLSRVLHDTSANGVVIMPREILFGVIEKTIQLCEVEGVEVWLQADFFNTQISRTSLDDLHGRPVLVFRTVPELSWQGFAKQLMDFFGALVFILLTSPLWIFFALWIKWSSPGPILFRQKRSGLNGKPFVMLKFRSMVNNAEQTRHELEVLNEMTGPVFKMADDPRITPIGAFMRKYSIDEWPQMLNVLRGEMSLVGPRPLPVEEVQRFDDVAHRRRLSVKPGLTCLWQVSGRNDVCDFKEWVRLDLEYIDNWSLWLDFKILVRTIPAVLTGNGAR